jgi:hypothetical protein
MHLGDACRELWTPVFRPASLGLVSIRQGSPGIPGEVRGWGAVLNLIGSAVFAGYEEPEASINSQGPGHPSVGDSARVVEPFVTTRAVIAGLQVLLLGCAGFTRAGRCRYRPARSWHLRIRAGIGGRPTFDVL